ncbi:thymidine kinase [Flavihumibacter stibioxidans]|uniref:Thymidine kinase n=1 Tax=Flavihumibacter stibioxidans TaxID=1834163 RepID=A0ABR7M5F1_9BACT|nr:thymidine kinase [Flavihumibacter stibioxidans]MBC6490202.1 thymidine kinase [Flavihumibacter stibioxidans]
MFIEPNLSGGRRGWIEVICGSMFSGKTEELIRRLKRARIANLKVEIFKPAIDVRYDEQHIVSHDENAIQSTPIDNSQTILLMASDVDVVGIDEAQFFDDELPMVCDQLARQGIRVIIAGLDMDYLGKPFGQMPFLLAKADYITKLHAICVKCGNIASFSYRKVAAESQVLLGEKESYEPRCRTCYDEKD